MKVARHDRPRTSSPSQGLDLVARPVLLATIEAPLTDEAATVAVDAAVECGQPLLVVNAVEASLAPCSLVLGYDTIVPPDVEESLRAPAELARSLGVEVERLRLRSPRPVDALLELVVERAPGLLVVGPDPTRIRPRTLRKAATLLRAGADCLVWLPDSCPPSSSRQKPNPAA